MALIVFSFPLPCITKWLAWVTARENVDLWQVIPRDYLSASAISVLCDIADIRHIGIMCLHDLRCGFIDLGIPHKLSADCQIQPAITAKKTSYAHLFSFHPVRADAL
jgi:hypothetical protein